MSADARIIVAAGKVPAGIRARSHRSYVQVPVLLEPLQELEVLHHLAFYEPVDWNGLHRVSRAAGTRTRLVDLMPFEGLLQHFPVGDTGRSARIATLRTHNSYSCFALNLTLVKGTSWRTCERRRRQTQLSQPGAATAADADGQSAHLVDRVDDAASCRPAAALFDFGVLQLQQLRQSAHERALRTRIVDPRDQLRPRLAHVVALVQVPESDSRKRRRRL